MIKIDVFSGFLGSGKTTLIKKLLQEAFKGEKIVLIENEFGEIGIDSGFLAEAGVHINEMNSGCICCSLVGDFAIALQKVISEFHLTEYLSSLPVSESFLTLSKQFTTQIQKARLSTELQRLLMLKNARCI